MQPILKKRPDWRNAGVSQLSFLFEGKTFCTYSQLYFAVERNIWKMNININTALCQERNLKRRHSSWAWGLLCEHPALHIGQPHRAHNTFWWSSQITLFCLIYISNLKTNHKEHKTPFDDLHISTSHSSWDTIFQYLFQRQGLEATKADWQRDRAKDERALHHYQLKMIETLHIPKPPLLTETRRWYSSITYSTAPEALYNYQLKIVNIIDPWPEAFSIKQQLFSIH